MNPDSDDDLREKLISSPSPTARQRNKNNKDEQNSKYSNVPKGKSSKKDHHVSWKDYPDRTIITNEPDIQLPNNSIKTTKYNWITFIPKNLFEQFSKLANLYFLLIGLLQMIPNITTTKGQPLIYIPLFVVVAVSAIKDLFEDLERRKDDSKENNSHTLKLTENGFIQCQWQDLKVGDIIRVEEGEFIPADMVILKTSEANGGCYLETKNLDGETNLKLKKAEKGIYEYFKSEKDLWEKHIKLDYEKQNPNLYTFTGTAKLDNKTKIPLDNKNVALRACSLKSPYAIGVIIYSGHHTKIMLNSVGARSKSSRLEKNMNKEILTIFIIQNIWCILSAIYATIWFETNSSFFLRFIEVTDGDEGSTALYFFERYGNWILLFTNFIPISLIVTLEMVKFIQAHIVRRDPKMIDSVIKTNASVHTSGLMEELGQVSHIFADKTGTLTCNVMEFKKLCVGKEVYGNDKNDQDLESKPKVSNVDFSDQKLFDAMKNEGSEGKQAQEMVFLLSICHSATLEEKDDQVNYTASSPDDIALVNFAKLCGYEFKGLDNSNQITLDINGDERKIKVLQQLEFSSERKMMSIIFETEDGEIIMYCKGADNALLNVMNQNENPDIDEIKKHLHEFASEGFRTLLVGKRSIPKEEYEEWSKKYEEALCAIEKRDEKVLECQQELEKEFIILGATAIEDKLQDKVDETIDILKKAGIKVWVLTGDKTETAINIGYSCKLLDNNQEIFVIDVDEEKELDQRIEEVTREISERDLGDDRPYAIVITGHSLVDSFNPAVQGEGTEKLFKVFSKAAVVLGCRISPKQKKDVVELVKKHNPSAITLAVGDGANDVNMITAAHVGVGIKGLEGYQAARASDFAIGEFKLMRRLLFFYGRESYRKNSYLILYNFFKNILLVLPHFWFGFKNGMSGTILYEPFIYQFYNVFYAVFPIIIFAVFDQEYDSNFLEKNPEYYTPGIYNYYFNFKLFWYWFSSASIQSIFVALIAFGSIETAALNQQGLMAGYKNSGMMGYTSVILAVNLKILLFSNTYNVLVALGILFSVVTYIGSFKVSSLLWFSADYKEYGVLFGNWDFYFGLVILITTTTLFDMAVTRYLNRKNLAIDQDQQNEQRKGQSKEIEL